MLSPSGVFVRVHLFGCRYLSLEGLLGDHCGEQCGSGYLGGVLSCCRCRLLAQEPWWLDASGGSPPVNKFLFLDWGSGHDGGISF